MDSKVKPNKVFYDESCYVCSLEINAIRKRGNACGIQFVDISDPEFEGDVREFNRQMIGSFDGQTTKGPETFRKMYEQLGFTRIVAFSRLPILRWLIDAGYYVFAYVIRPILPRKPRSRSKSIG